MFSHDWIYLYINRIAASYGETTPEELTGKSFLEVYPRVIETGDVQANGEMYDQ